MKTFSEWFDELPEEIRTSILECKNERLVQMGWQAAMESVLAEKLEAENKKPPIREFVTPSKLDCIVDD